MNVHDQILHQQFTEYGRNAREWMRKCVLLLPEINRRHIWKKKKCSSIYEYAAKLAGMSRPTVEDALRIMKKVEELPALKEVVAEKGLQRVRPIITIATPETQNFWAEKAKSMSKLTLQTYVKDYRLERRSGTAPQSVKLTMELPPELAKELQKLKGDGTWNELIEKLLKNSTEVTLEKPQAVKTVSRHIPQKIIRYVDKRDGGVCAYPSCTRKATSLHHTQRWGLEKVHDPDRLRSLCTTHERLAHLGLIENEDHSPEKWAVKEKANQNDYKFYIDRFVQLYRPT